MENVVVVVCSCSFRKIIGGRTLPGECLQSKTNLVLTADSTAVQMSSKV